MGKLVRDNVPDLIRAQGGDPQWHYARPEEYWHELLEKLREEVDEFLDSQTEADLVDVMDIVDAIAAAKDNDRVQWMRDEKAKRKGTFSKHIILDSS